MCYLDNAFGNLLTGCTATKENLFCAVARLFKLVFIVLLHAMATVQNAAQLTATIGSLIACFRSSSSQPLAKPNEVVPAAEECEGSGSF